MLVFIYIVCDDVEYCVYVFMFAHVQINPSPIFVCDEDVLDNKC